jgi:hypothetical protein
MEPVVLNFQRCSNLPALRRLRHHVVDLQHNRLVGFALVLLRFVSG